MKVPVDSTYFGYSGSNAGQMTLLNGSITDANIASSGITTAGKVSGNAITSGTIGGSTAINTSGTISSGTITSSGSISASSGTVSGGSGAFTSGLTLGGNTVNTGAGVAGYIPEYTGANVIGDSPIYDNSGNIGIGTTTASEQLQITKNMNVATTSIIKMNSVPFIHATGTANAFLGNSAGNASSITGSRDTAMGYGALAAITSGSDNACLGEDALTATTSGIDNVAVGSGALKANTTGSANTAIGMSAGSQNTTGSNNTYLGENAGSSSTSTNLSNAAAIGANSLINQSSAIALGGTLGSGNDVAVAVGTDQPADLVDVRGGASVGIPGIQPFTSTLNTTMTSTSPANGGTIALTCMGGSNCVQGVYPMTGTILIDSEAISYTSVSNNNFLNITRGALGTVAAAHSTGASVYNYNFTVRTSSPAPALTVTSQGKVGLGTATPSSTLSVAGTVQSTTGGFKFPDGTVQTSASGKTGGKVSATASPMYLTGTPTAVPGCSVTLSPSTAVNVLVITTYDFAANLANNDSVNVGDLYVDGTILSGSDQAILQLDTTTTRATVSQSYWVSLSAGSHTLTMYAYNTAGSYGIVNASHTSMTYVVFGQ